jgi:uncharacterized repeat protein (TIGR01451 family)
MNKSKSIHRMSMHSILSLIVCATISLSSNVFAYSPGKDGVGSVTTANTVINTYYTVTSTLNVGNSTVPLSSVTGLSVGDVLMLYQAQGATITTANDATYGTVSDLGNAGRYELVSIVSISGSTVMINTACSPSGLRFSYTNGLTQAIRVPQYSSLTVSGTGSITANAWGGSTGGVVAAIVQNTASIGGAGITVAGRGFRGGVLDNATTAQATDVTLFVGTLDADGGEKGESIAGFQAEYDLLGGRYARGAPANGGGGGTAHNAGGGGGANGNNGVTWTGSGIPSLAGTGSTVANWTDAWNLEAAGFATSTSSGGGRGGYSFGNSNQDAVTVGPGGAWGGNRRRQRGGLGGRPLTNDATGRLFFGGGGGAGDANNSAGSSGAAGGGIVLLIANTINGGGTINANGLTAGNSTPGHNDAPGGGGGGGSIVLSGTVGAITLDAAGGNGGNQLITNNESEGPGGGGGGGFIATGGGTTSILCGNSGTTSSGAVTEFIVNGATNAATGNTTGGPVLSSLPICPNPITDFSITKSNGVVLPATLTSGQSTTYALVVTNNGPSTVTGAFLQDPIVAGLNITAVACPSFTGGASLPLLGNVTIINLTGPGIPMPSMAPGSTITCNVTATVTATGF